MSESPQTPPGPLRWLVRFVMQFLLPILAAGPILWGGEAVVHALGLPVTDSQFVRVLLLVYYGVIAVVLAMRKRHS